MTRRQRIEAIQRRLGKRKVVWFGTRGTDAQPLLVLPQFSEIFSIIAPLGALSVDSELCLETLKRERVDLDRYSLDDDKSTEAMELHRRLFASLGEPAVVVTYRPGSFFTSIYYPRSECVQYLGLFHERQAPFEHKPWVESELKKLGVNVVPWHYFGDEDRLRLEEALEQGPLVLRTNRTDGGAGLRLIRRSSDIASLWPPHPDGFLGAAPYLEPNIPLNVNACVFQDGAVSLHALSFQLIGLAGYTCRTFGYCGNDFAQVSELDSDILDALEDTVLKAGKWLARSGYLGAFGIDAIVHEGQVYLTEINPRFQGSSAISVQIDTALDRPDMFLDHMAAFLGIMPPPPVHLRELAKQQPRISQIVCHNCDSHPLRRNTGQVMEVGKISCTLLPADDVRVQPEAILLRAIIEDSVSESGWEVRKEYDDKLQDLLTHLYAIRMASSRREGT